MPVSPAQPATNQEPAKATPAQASDAVAAESSDQDQAKGGKGSAITEEEVKQLVVGKTLYLRGEYLDDSLSFDEHGKLIGHSLQGS